MLLANQELFEVIFAEDVARKEDGFGTSNLKQLEVDVLDKFSLAT